MPFGKLFIENHFWCNPWTTWVTGCIHGINRHTWCWVISYECAHQVAYRSTALALHMSRWTHSEVIWATSCREVKPEFRKLSLYWLILMAASQSSTELKVLKSGMDLSNSGWEGLQRREGKWEVRGGQYSAGLGCNIMKGGFEEKERNCGYGFRVGVCERMQKGEVESVSLSIYLSIHSSIYREKKLHSLAWMKNIKSANTTPTTNKHAIEIFLSVINKETDHHSEIVNWAQIQEGPWGKTGSIASTQAHAEPNVQPLT